MGQKKLILNKISMQNIWRSATNIKNTLRPGIGGASWKFLS